MPGAALAEVGEGRADRVRRAEHVRLDHRPPLLRRLLEEAPLGAEAGVREDDVDAAEAFERRRHEPLLVVPDRDVAALGQSSLVAAHLGRDLAHPPPGGGDDRERVAGAGRQPRRGGTYAGARARDQHDRLVGHGLGFYQPPAGRLRARMPVDPTEARFPSIPRSRGHYESFYMRACHPSDPLGVWIRYTVHKRPGREPTGSLWFTLFDATAPGPVASKVMLPADRVNAEGGIFVSIGESTFSPGSATGSAHSDQARPDWRLTYEADAPALTHLPRDWMYRPPIPRTKLTSPSPAATFAGELELDGRRIEVDG